MGGTIYQFLNTTISLKYHHLNSFITELYELPCDEEWEIDRSQITLREQLGEGAFGLVMRADAVGLPDLPSTCSVAVKMLKGKSVLINPFYWKR